MQLVESLGGAQLPRIVHVDDAEALGEDMAGVGVPVVDHELHAIGATALIAMDDQTEIAGVAGALADPASPSNKHP